MPQTITVSSHIYKRLENHVSGFDDTPEKVIERLLDTVEQLAHSEKAARSVTQKDYSKYKLDDGLEEYGKGRLVLAVIKDYVAKHRPITYSELLKAFPKSLQGSFGVFEKYEEAEKRFLQTQHKRHYLQDRIKLSDCDIAVCSQWGKDNISNFIQKAEIYGYSVTQSKG